MSNIPPVSHDWEEEQNTQEHPDIPDYLRKNKEKEDQQRSVNSRKDAIGASPSSHLFDSRKERGVPIDPNRVGIWGLPGSGKTTYLTMLYHTYHENWRVLLGDSNTEQLLAGKQIDDPVTFLADLYSNIISKREYPPPTPPDAINIFAFRLQRKPRSNPIVESIKPKLLKRYILPWKRPQNREGEETEEAIEAPGRIYHLDFVDASGEAFRDPRRWQFPNLPHPIDILKRCQNIICLLDIQPFLETETHRWKKGYGAQTGSSANQSGFLNAGPLWQDYFKDLLYLLSQLEKNERLLEASGQSTHQAENRLGISRYRIALCVSKADIPVIWRSRNDLPGLISRFLHASLLHEIERWITKDRYRWFAVSAVGPHLVDGEPVSTTDDEGHIIQNHEVRPYRLFEPIEWLLGERQ